jgi:hypothetical protein
MEIKIPKLKELVLGQFLIYHEPSFTRDLNHIDIHKIISFDEHRVKMQTSLISLTKNGGIKVIPWRWEEISEVNGKSVTEDKFQIESMEKSFVKKHYFLFQDYLDARMKYLEQERENIAKLSEIISAEEMKEIR